MCRTEAAHVGGVSGRGTPSEIEADGKVVTVVHVERTGVSATRPFLWVMEASGVPNPLLCRFIDSWFACADRRLPMLEQEAEGEIDVISKDMGS